MTAVPQPPPPPTRLAETLDRNDTTLRALIDQHAPDLTAVQCAIFARCWADDAPRRGVTNIPVHTGETLDQARQRLNLLWTPQWLLDAGFSAYDAAGTAFPDMHSAASISGPIVWDPLPVIPRLDDQARVTPGNFDLPRERQIAAGAVAVAALWASDAVTFGLGIADIDLTLSALASSTAGQKRGARFANALAYVLEQSLPAGWRIETEVSIKDIFGLHLRSHIAERSADIVIISPGDKVMAFASSKFSWRSDRGTEAAQMVFLQRYRPDLPYVLVTAEFPRFLSGVANESIEDQAYHLVPDWVVAWQITQELPNAGQALTDLQTLRTAAAERRTQEGLQGLGDLLTSMRTARRYL